MQNYGEEETVKTAQAVKASSRGQPNNRDIFSLVIKLEIKIMLSGTDYCYIKNDKRLLLFDNGNISHNG